MSLSKPARSVPRARSTNAAVALALLGLGADSAAAEATLFETRTGAAHPFAGFDVGTAASPAFGDLDADGDFDVVVGTGGTNLEYYANDGTALAPVFVARTGVANPLNGVIDGGIGNPALGDLDGDGDLDLLVATAAGPNVELFVNGGTARTPAFAPGAGVPLVGVAVGVGAGDPRTVALVDLEGDGDLDLVAGGLAGTLAFFENTGSATSPAFTARTGAASPFDGFDVGDHSDAVFGDLDRDGDPDLVVGSGAGTFVFFENTGTATAAVFALWTGGASPLDVASVGVRARPALADLDGDGDGDLLSGDQDGTFDFLENLSGRLVARTGAANPLAGLVPGGDGRPAFGDLDGDGDAELVVGADDGTLRYFANTGSASSPVWVERTGAANPLAGQDVGLAAAPALGDLDGDGDLDLVVGENDGVFNDYRNTGSPTAPAFALRTGAANPLNGQTVGNLSTPALGDLDHDGDPDLVAGELDGVLDYYENTGTAAAPAFVLRLGVDSPVDGFDVGQRSAPDLGDADGDGDLDLLVGSSTGTFALFENRSLATLPVFVPRTGAANPLDGEDVGSNATPAFVDTDGDGDEDVVSGETSPVFDVFENTILDASLAAMELSLPINPLDGFAVPGSHSSPAWVDLDADGDLDVVAGAWSGLFSDYENTGSATHAAYLERFGAAHPVDAVDVGELAAPAFGDLDGDGDPDLVAGRFAGSFAYYENTGSATRPVYVARTGTASPLQGRDVGYLSAPCLGDLDADGDLDLVIGELDGDFAYYENTGTAVAPAFLPRTGASNPLGAALVPGWSTPALGDVDGDGDLDLFSGDQLGQFSYFENTGTPRIPVFAARTGTANPLDGQDVGSRSAPTLGDFDADGQLDLLTGNHVAGFQTYVLPEPGWRAGLAAGLAWLGALRGRRRSRSVRGSE
ncbi:MAG: FG-GAP-like repeat-containing protein [Myxococcota bacterium]